MGPLSALRAMAGGIAGRPQGLKGELRSSHYLAASPGHSLARNPMTAYSFAGDSAPCASRVFLATLLGLALLLAWDHSGLDLWMAHGFGTPAGFPLEDHWFWRGTLHDDIRWLPRGLELALLAAVMRPFGALRRLAMERRVQLALTTLVSLLAVSTLKLHSLTSCPWELHEFGGTVAYVSHWAWGVHDGGSGGCFPAGHASAGFAFLGGFFAFRHALPRTARRWLAGALLAGLVLGSRATGARRPLHEPHALDRLAVLGLGGTGRQHRQPNAFAKAVAGSGAGARTRGARVINPATAAEGWYSTSMSRGTGFARPQAGGPLGGSGATRSERPWGPYF